MKTRFLIAVFALIVLAFIALLAFLPSVFGIHSKHALVATISPPAAAEASPAAKTTIMGTPAQLIEDLKTAGIDIVNARLLRKEVLTKARREVDSGLCTYSCANGSISIDTETNQLQAVYFFSPQYLATFEDLNSEGLPVLPTGTLKPLIEAGKQAVITRYGDVSVKFTESLTYHILVKGEKEEFWDCFIMISEKLGVEGLSIERPYRALWRLNAKRVDGRLAVSGDGGKLYKDLAAVGLDLGMPCSKPEVIARGKVLKQTPKYIRYGFANGQVVQDIGTTRIRSYFLHDKGIRNLQSFFSTINSWLRGERPLSLGAVGKAFRAGIPAFEQNYGGSTSYDSTRYSQYTQDSVEYGILLDNGSGLQVLDISCYSLPWRNLRGSVQEPLYIYTPQGKGVVR